MAKANTNSPEFNRIDPGDCLGHGGKRLHLLLLSILAGLLALTLSGTALALECFPQTHPLPDGVDPETGYRMERYRAPVPSSIPGGCVASTADIIESNSSGTPSWVFIDVYPPRGLGADPLNGNWLISEEHDYIEGSVWLPEVGRGYVEQEHIDYFSHNLEQLTNGDKSRHVMLSLIHI